MLQKLEHLKLYGVYSFFDLEARDAVNVVDTSDASYLTGHLVGEFR